MRPGIAFLLVLPACLPDSGEDSADPLAGLQVVAEDPPGASIAGLSDDWRDRFLEGDAAFETSFRETQGLGPAYIRTSCSACHGEDGRGPGIVTKMVIPDDPEADAALLPWGHTERPYVAGGASTPLVAPEDDRILYTTRAPPPVFGRGAMEAIDDATILDLAEAQAVGGLVSGRPNTVTCEFEANPDSLFPTCTDDATAIGRFGLKARVATLDGFAADAFQGDMSMTSPMRPDELPNPDGLTDDALSGIDLDIETINFTADYTRTLAIPSRAETEGEALFEATGCAECHVPSLPTRADWPIPQLADTDVAVFTDLLLHDMGEGFSDGLTDGDAGPSEWRTAPLMGMRFLRTFLHDGRADSVEAATVAHGAVGSEAAFSAERFNQLDDGDRATLLAYVESL